MYMAKTRDVEVPMLGSLLGSNRLHIERAAELVLARGGRRVGLIGLSFKAGTDDLRESPLVTLAEILIGKGLELSIYDPHVNVSVLMGANKRYIDQHVPHVAALLKQDCADVIRGAQTIVVGALLADAVDALKSVGNAGPVHPRLGWNARRARAPRRISGCLLVAPSESWVQHIRLRRNQMCDRGVYGRAYHGVYVKRWNARKMEPARSSPEQ